MAICSRAVPGHWRIQLKGRRPLRLYRRLMDYGYEHVSPSHQREEALRIRLSVVEGKVVDDLFEVPPVRLRQKLNHVVP